MKPATFPLLLLLPFLSHAASGVESLPVSGAKGDSPVRMSTGQPIQGEPVVVEASPLPGADHVVMIWKGQEIPMRKEGPGRFLGLIGIDLQEPPGKTVLSVRASRDDGTVRFDAEIEVREGTFPVQELTLPRAMTEFDAETLDRIRREAEALAGRFSGIPSDPAWRFPFLPPVGDFRPKGFGARRIINGEPRSPHAGVDVDLPEGTPVVAIADGTVAFAGDQFFGGNSVVLDHGGGVFSVYYHLQEYAVTEGKKVARGERIGAVGSSGRATGPHLHFSVRAAGGRIDPALLYALPPR
ncbi:MAG TPA: M23 family metallopeptidase [Candidatus Deferrimicrobiaceae bacterium]|nr:M23 family metallopeptidase [Candidatus Deferrimicrobiaceae bacterium]